MGCWVSEGGMVGGCVIWARWLVGWVRRRGCNEGGSLVCCVVGSGLLGEVGIEGGRCVGVGGWVKLVVIGGGGRGNLICCHVLVVLVVCWGKCIVCEGGCADVGNGEVRGILVSVWIVCHGGGSVSERVVGGLVVLIGYMWWCDGLCMVVIVIVIVVVIIVVVIVVVNVIVIVVSVIVIVIVEMPWHQAEVP